MTPFDQAAAAAAALGTVLLLVYLTGFRNQDAGSYNPIAAWLRALVYFCFCFVVAWWSGALQATFESICVTSEQLASPLWWVVTLALYAFIVGAYWGFWRRHTIRFDRKLEFLPQLIFGLLWGFTSGLFFLAFWYFAKSLGPDWPTWAVWLTAYIGISVWQMFWMDMYWDVYVAPEHDSPHSIKIKVPRTHIPNMTLCLTHFAFFENHWIFISLQTLALLAASFGMRMPSPWNDSPTPPATVSPGLFGLPRASGYVSKDPENDPYLKAANLPG